MKKEQLNKPVYFIAKDGIEKITYKQYLEKKERETNLQFFNTYIEALEFIKDDENLLDSNNYMMAELYSYNGIEYVVLCDNTLITREEDNKFGEEQAIFPYLKN